MSIVVRQADDGLTWQLLYTNPQAEEWVDANLREQGFSVLLPRVRTRATTVPLFPRYVFEGYEAGQRAGVSHVVNCGDRPARVTPDAIPARMDQHGVAGVERLGADNSNFDLRARACSHTDRARHGRILHAGGVGGETRFIHRTRERSAVTLASQINTSACAV